jgi:hypothetical protein
MELTMESIMSDVFKFERKIKRRNLLEWAACVFIVVFLSFTVLNENHILVKIGAIGMIFSAIFIGLFLFKKGRIQPFDKLTVSTSQFMKEYCAELQKQEKLLRSVPIWYLGPMAISIAVMLIGKMLEAAATGAPIIYPIIVFGIVTIAFIIVAMLNYRATTKLHLKIAKIQSENTE